MIIYEFYVYNNTGLCVFHEELESYREPLQRTYTQQLLFGLIYSLKSFCKKFSPESLEISPFTSYTTDSYKLHILETHSGLNFILVTDSEIRDQTGALKYVYSNLYSPFVLRNPFYTPKQFITSGVFRSKLIEYLKSLR